MMSRRVRRAKPTRRQVRPRVVAVLETMYDWRGYTTGAGYREAPRFFRINPQNYSGKRLYRLIEPSNADLLVTNACRELGRGPNDHGEPDPVWLKENIDQLMRTSGCNLILICGRPAQKCYREAGIVLPPGVQTLEILHPAARNGHWTQERLDQTAGYIKAMLEGRA